MRTRTGFLMAAIVFGILSAGGLFRSAAADGEAINEDGNPLASNLFHAYVTYAVGSCAEATAIGDVNNDGRNDVVVGTTDNDDPTNDNRIHVFLQDGSGYLTGPAKHLVGFAIGGDDQCIPKETYGWQRQSSLELGSCWEFSQLLISQLSARAIGKFKV